MFRDCTANQETLIVKFFVLGAIARDIISQSSSEFSAGRLNSKITPPVYALGGCAINIALPLHDAGLVAHMVAPLGDDPVATGLLTEIHAKGLATEHVLSLSGPQSTAVIITDPTGSQHTYFAPGIDPTAIDWQNHLNTITLSGSDCVVQAPHKPELMLTTLAWAEPAGLTVWSPGQYIDELSSDDIKLAFSFTDMLVVNQYEASRLQNFDGPTIITDSARPIKISWRKEYLEIAIPAKNATDPTGCGDAFLAGLLIGLGGRPPKDVTALSHAVSKAIGYAHRCLAEHGALSYLS